MKKLILAGWLAAVMSVGSATAQDYNADIANACGGEGGCITWMTRIIGCESQWDPSAWHPNPYGGADVGLLQIHDATWGDIAYAGGTSQIYWAADMYRAGMSGEWVCQ